MSETRLYNCISCGRDTEYQRGFCGWCRCDSPWITFKGKGKALLAPWIVVQRKSKALLAIHGSLLPAPTEPQQAVDRSPLDWKIPTIGKAKKKTHQTQESSDLSTATPSNVTRLRSA